MLTDRQWSNGIINSLLVALLTAALATVLGTLAALGISRGRFPGQALVERPRCSPLIVPVVVIAIGMFGLFVQEAGRVGDGARAGPHGTGAAVRRRQRQHVAPDDGPHLELAAADLGADPRRSFFHITLPIILPGVVAGAIFSFITSWDEIVVAIFMTSARSHRRSRCGSRSARSSIRPSPRYRRHSSS